MKEERTALQLIRRLSQEFIEGQIPFDEFWSKLRNQLGGTFDPLDQAIADLSPEEKDEVLFYFSLDGGESEETEPRLPRDPNWRYGHSATRYGWVDKEKFRQTYAVEFKKRVNAQPTSAGDLATRAAPEK